MRLESAMFASKSGMDVSSGALNSVGDNVANANTVGYKSSRVEFSDLVAAAESDRLADVDDGAGEGAMITDVRTIFEAGVLEPTGRDLDVGIGGGGFFAVGDVAAPDYTRNGTFSVDSTGRLVTTEGYPVLGLQGTGTTLGELNVNNIETAGAVTSAVTLNGNLDSGKAVTQIPANPESYNEIAAAASYTASQTVYDSQGGEHSIFLAFFKTAANVWNVQAYLDGADTGGEAGTPVALGAAQQLNFDGTGGIPEANQANAVLQVTPQYANGAAAGPIAIDFSSFTQYAGGSIITNVEQDGRAAGNVKGYEFDSDGKFYALLDTGARAQVGQVQLTTFQNNDGLERKGANLFRITDETGDATTGNPGTGTFGTLEAGSLERSTVDISKEFINMVLFQRAFQANTQVFTTAAQMVKDTVGLIR